MNSYSYPQGYSCTVGGWVGGSIDRVFLQSLRQTNANNNQKHTRAIVARCTHAAGAVDESKATRLRTRAVLQVHALERQPASTIPIEVLIVDGRRTHQRVEAHIETASR